MSTSLILTFGSRKLNRQYHILLSHGYKWLHQCIIMLWHKKKSICLFDLQHDKKYCHSSARATVERVFCIFYLGGPVSLFPSNLSFLYIKFTNQKQKEQFPHQHFLHLLASPSPLLLFLGKKNKKMPSWCFHCDYCTVNNVCNNFPATVLDHGFPQPPP